jgi:hypothetical protein
VRRELQQFSLTCKGLALEDYVDIEIWASRYNSMIPDENEALDRVCQKSNGMSYPHPGKKI